MNHDAELYLSHTRLAELMEKLLQDTPDPDGGDFYTQARNTSFLGETRGPNDYGGWRTSLSPEALAWLRGFRKCMEHMSKIIPTSQGGASETGIAMSLCPYELLELSRKQRSYEWREMRPPCDCDKCIADVAKTTAREAKARAAAIKRGDCVCHPMFTESDCPQHGGNSVHT